MQLHVLHVMCRLHSLCGSISACPHGFWSTQQRGLQVFRDLPTLPGPQSDRTSNLDGKDMERPNRFSSGLSNSNGTCVSGEPTEKNIGSTLSDHREGIRFRPLEDQLLHYQCVLPQPSVLAKRSIASGLGWLAKVNDQHPGYYASVLPCADRKGKSFNPHLWNIEGYQHGSPITTWLSTILNKDFSM